MRNTTTPTNVLITAMTYPLPSQSCQEVVCTAGITEAGEWVRLYPVDYRYQPKERQFHKYQWVEVALEPRGSGNDNRKEHFPYNTWLVLGVFWPPKVAEEQLELL
jgi:hypothetical protein